MGRRIGTAPGFPLRSTSFQVAGAVIANLAYGLAVDGLTDLVPALLDINEALGELTDEISQADVIYSDEIIAGTVCLIRTSQALLDDGGIVQTIH